jgi:hypothetical protein
MKRVFFTNGHIEAKVQPNPILDRKGLMGLVCLSVRLSVTPLLQRKQNHMSKGNKESQP